MAPRERQRQIALLVLGIVGLILVIGGIGYLIGLFECPAGLRRCAPGSEVPTGIVAILVGLALMWLGVRADPSRAAPSGAASLDGLRGIGWYVVLGLAAALNVAVFGLLFGLFECPGGECGPGYAIALAVVAIVLVGVLVLIGRRSRSQ